MAFYPQILLLISRKTGYDREIERIGFQRECAKGIAGISRLRRAKKNTREQQTEKKGLESLAGIKKHSEYNRAERTRKLSSTVPALWYGAALEILLILPFSFFVQNRL